MSILAMIIKFDIPVVQSIQNFDSVEALLAYTAPLEGVEGFIVAFPNGDRYKIKADQYVRIHKIKDRIRSDRHVLALIMDNSLDDILPHLDEKDLAKVREFETKFWTLLTAKVTNLETLVHMMVTEANYDKKTLAVEVMPKYNVDTKDKRFAFSYADGKKVSEMVRDVVLSSCNANNKFDEMMEWLTK
jgi:RNA ligase